MNARRQRYRPLPSGFACRETALRSNPAAGASRKGRYEVRLSAHKGLGLSNPHGSRLHERDANVSLRAVSGCAVKRRAHTSGRGRHRRRRGSGRSVSGEPPSRCGRWGSPTPGPRFSIAAITVPAIRRGRTTRAEKNACSRLMREPLDRRGSDEARTGGPEFRRTARWSTDTDRPRLSATSAALAMLCICGKLDSPGSPLKRPQKGDEAFPFRGL